VFHKLKYRVLNERLAVCRAAADAPIPAWAQAAEFFCVVRTTDELSIVCPQNACPQNRIAPIVFEQTRTGLKVEAGWMALKLEGPFPFSMTGVLASFVQPLAEAQIPIFAISTFDTDYVLVKEEDLQRALTALHAVGHESAG
jgi:uncharacterized protein